MHPSNKIVVGASDAMVARASSVMVVGASDAMVSRARIVHVVGVFLARQMHWASGGSGLWRLAVVSIAAPEKGVVRRYIHCAVWPESVLFWG